MKTAVRIIFFLILVSSPLISLKAQYFEVGTNAGFTAGTKSGFPQSGEDLEFSQLGAGVHYQPRKAIFHILSGLNYIGNLQTDWYRLRMPLGIVFTTKKKLHLDFGGGLYYSLFPNASGENLERDKTTYHSNQAGAWVAAGLGYTFYHKHTLWLRWEGQYDFTPFSETERHSPGGSKYTDKEYSKFKSFNIGYAYRLPKKTETDH